MTASEPATRGPQRGTRPLWLASGVALLLGALVALMLLVASRSTRQAERDLAARGQEQLGLYASGLQAFIDRYRALPEILAVDPELRTALASERIDDATRARLNHKLEQVNGAARTSTLTLIGRDGIALAANNWRQADSNVGVDYRFRPYFQDAMRQGVGRFYGIGITTGVPGYYLAQAVSDDADQRLGVVVVKVPLAALEAEWASAKDVVLVSDADGVVFLANRAAWRYHALNPQSAAHRAQLAGTQQYGAEPLPLLDWQALPDRGDGIDRLRVASEGLGGRFLRQSQTLPGTGWTLHLLQPTTGTAKAGRTAALAAAGVALSLVFLALFMQQRLRLWRLQQKSRAELEQLVAQHTTALRSAEDGVVQAAERASSGQHRSLEHLPQGVGVIDAELKLTAWNRRYTEIFRYPPEMMRVGLPIEDLLRYNARRGLLGSDNLEEAVQRRLDHLRAGKPYLFEREWADGTVLEIRGNPLPGGGFVTAYTDITAYKASARELRTLAGALEQRVQQRTEDLSAAQQAAERANRSKTSFIAAAVHDLLQPLNAARLYNSALRERLADEAHATLAANVEEALSAQDDILSSLLDISRLESGAIQTDVRDLDLQALFDALLRDFGPLAATRGLVLQAVPTRAVIASDAVLLRRILQNFVSNALRYTAQGRVVLAARREGAKLRIEVRDSGGGIAEQQHRLIFEEFHRLDTGAREPDRGAGLGLAIVERIARRLGHAIALRSQPGRGSVFSVTVPRGDAAAVQRTPMVMAEPTSALQHRRLWCIDDDARVREAMRALLQGWGCDVTVAGSAAEALALASPEAVPELVLVDYRLGDSTGPALIPKLFARWGQAPPVVVISADREVASLAATEAGWGFLPKPVRASALRALLRQMLLKKVAPLPLSQHEAP